MRLNWSATCDSVWPIGSIYITINIATANDVKKKLGCGTWQMIEANRTLWSTTSNGGTLLSACLPSIAESSFSITNGAYFNAISTSSDNVFQTPICSSAVYEHAGYAADGDGTVNMDFSKATGSLHSDACTTIIPSAIKVYIWKRTA